MGLEETGAKLTLQGQEAFTSGMKKAQDASTGFGSALSNVAAGIAQGFGQALFGVVSQGLELIPNLMKGAVDATMEWGQQLDDIGDILGTTAGQSAGLATMFQTIGGDSGQLTGAMAKMAAGLMDAKGQLGPTGTALKGLGIDFKDAQGNILPATDIFQRVADKLGNMPDGLEKTSLMMDIFGKSGKEMGDALAAASNGGMDLYIRKAKEMGLALDPQEIIDQKMAAQTLDLAFKGIQITLGKALLPVIQRVTYGIVHMLSDPAIKAGIKFITDGISWLTGVFENLFNDVSGGSTIFGALIDTFDGLIPDWLLNVLLQFDAAMQNLPIVAQESLTLLSGIFEWAFGTIQANFNSIMVVVQSAVDGLSSLIKVFLDSIQKWWGENGAAITAGVQSMWAGVQGAFNAALGFIQALVSFVLINIQNFWQAHGDQILSVVTWLWNAVQVVFNTAIGIITNIFQAFTSLLQGDWDGFLNKLLAAWDLLWGLIRGVAEDAWGKLSGWFNGIVDQILAFFNNTDWGQVGRNIIDGIWNGLKNGWNWLIDQIKALAARLLAAALAALGINPGGGGNNNPPGGGPNNNGNGPGGAQYNGFGAQNNVQGLFGGAQMMGAGPNVNNYNTAYNYNLNLTTQQTSQGVQQSFAIMQMMG